MSTQLQLFGDDKAYQLSPTSATFAPGLLVEEWSRMGISAIQAAGSMRWWIGDWMAYGERNYGDSAGKALIPQVGIDVQALGSVANGVEPEQRVLGLSWEHHREVKDLKAKEQRDWLQKAKKEGWSVSDLRCAIRKQQAIYQDAKMPSLFIPDAWARRGVRELRRIRIDAMSEEQREELGREIGPVREEINRLWEELRQGGLV